MLQAQAMAGGLSAIAAQALGGTIASGLTATGTTNANALALSQAINQFSTVAAGTGAILPTFAVPGDVVEIYNGGANALLVYPPVLGQINALTVTTGGFSVAAGKSARFVRFGAIGWFSSLSA